MKLALIGTHGVGKTTLCYDLAARLKRLDRGVDLVKEVARECPLPINQDTTLEAQSWILHEQCALELAASNAAEVVVCDRSVLDNYAYLVHAAGRQAHLEGWLAHWCEGYTRLFKVPVWQTPSFDGTRDTDLGFQREIDETLDGLIEDLEIDVFRLGSGNPNGWVADILRELEVPWIATQGRLFSDEGLTHGG
jgi:hypothetical protein